MTDYKLAIKTPTDIEEVRTQASALEHLIQKKVVEVLGDLTMYALPERMAIIEVHKFNLLLDIEKVPFFAKVAIAMKVAQSWSSHPSLPSSLKEFVTLNTTISYSEFSNLVDIGTRIIPYLEEQGIDPLDIFRAYRPSNIREIIPTLRSIITGEPSKSPEVNETIERVKADIRDTNPGATEEEVRRGVVDRILEEAAGSNGELRNFLRPNNTPDILFSAIEREGVKYVWAKIDYDQLVMLQQLGQGHISVYVIDRPEESPVWREIADG